MCDFRSLHVCLPPSSRKLVAWLYKAGKEFGGNFSTSGNFFTCDWGYDTVALLTRNVRRSQSDPVSSQGPWLEEWRTISNVGPVWTSSRILWYCRVASVGSCDYTERQQREKGCWHSNRPRVHFWEIQCCPLSAAHSQLPLHHLLCRYSKEPPGGTLTSQKLLKRAKQSLEGENHFGERRNSTLHIFTEDISGNNAQNYRSKITILGLKGEIVSLDTTMPFNAIDNGPFGTETDKDIIFYTISVL